MDDALPPSTHFQWNVGGWFGGQLGGTLWMLVAAACLVPVDPAVAAITFGVFLVPNVLGLYLWRHRARYRPYPCLQLLIAVMGVCALALFLVWHGMPTARMAEAFDRQSDRLHYAWLLLFPGLMLMFHVQERAARRRLESQRSDTGPIS